VRLIRQKPEEIMIIDGKTMNEKGKKQRMFQWRALPSPKMPWETFKRMITMERFSDFTEMERPNEVSIKVTVQFAGQIANDMGVSSKVLEVEKGAKLKAILEQVDKRTGGRYNFLVSVDNKQVIDYNISVDEDSDILLITPMSGG
jgi:molybdopterin converting factor small subunit